MKKQEPSLIENETMFDAIDETMISKQPTELDYDLAYEAETYELSFALPALKVVLFAVVAVTLTIVAAL